MTRWPGSPWRARGAGIVAGAAALAAAGGAVGQDDPDLVRRLERQLREIDATYRLAVPDDQPISERLVLDYGGSVRFGIFGVDASSGSTRFLRQTDGVLYLRAELDGTHRFFGRLRFLYDDFNSGDSFDGRGDELRVALSDRYWYEFDLRGAYLADTGAPGPLDLRVRAGRQYVHWGSGLALSNALYAVVADARFGDLGVRGLAGLTPSSWTVDFDGARPSFDTDTDRGYFGAVLEHRGLATHRPYVSALVQRDYNDRDFAVFDIDFGAFTESYPTSFDYDSEYYAIGSAGSLGPQLDYRVELVHERGRALSNSFDRATGLPIAQTREDVEAWAGVARLTYLLRDDNDTRFDLEFVGGSGDDDRIDSSDTFGGNTPGTDDRAFNGLGYVNTGLALVPEVSNLLSLRLGVSTAPVLTGRRADWLRLGASAFLFAKADQSAPLNVRTDAETFVGGELDLYLDWRLASDVNLIVRYGLFLPGDAMPEGEDDPRHFVYAGVTYAF